MSPSFATRAVLAAACFGLAAAPEGRAQSPYRMLSLRVTDVGTQAPLPGVQVTVRGVGDRDWSTDAEGRVLVGVARGSRARLQFRRMGYAPVDVAAPAGDAAAELAVAMRPAVHALDTSRVVGDARSVMLSGFEGRRLRGAGAATFVTREQIEKQMAIRTIDVVRRAVGTRVIDSSGVLLVASSRGAKSLIAGIVPGGAKASAKANDLAPCVMRVAVDGMMREWGYSLDEIDPKEIHGVEVYPGPATIPAEFAGMRRDAYCGLVMIWTRRGP